MIIALGGGVVSDMAGFAASIFERGIKFINIPTTLLAQVDASVGGKTGVNNKFGKNLIGSFYQPSAVYCETGFLKTLEKREFAAGLAEATKTLVNKLFADRGLLMIDGDDPRLKEQMKEIFADELKNNSLKKETHQSVENLTKKYGKVQVNPREINLFYLTEQAV